MKYKKILCGMLAAALVAGMAPGNLITEAAETVQISNTVSIDSLSESDFTFDRASGTIIKYVGNAAEVAIPEKIGGVAVKVIGEDAFASNETVTSVVIPKGVTKIGAEAFLNCPNLKSVKIPNGVTEIGEVAFFKCTSLETVVFGSGVARIEESVFYGCSSLKEMQIPNTVTAIEAGAFMGCDSLKNVAVPNSVTSIGWGAFKNCTGLTEISISPAVTDMEEEIFSGCDSVKVTCEEGSAAHKYAQSSGAVSNVVEKVDNVTPEIKDDVTPTMQPEATSKPVVTSDPTVTPEAENAVYSISYVLNGGKIKGTKPVRYDGKTDIRLPKITRKGYTFSGWYKESSYRTKVSVLRAGNTGNQKFYAKWVKVRKPSRPSISYVKNKKSKQMTVKLKKKVSGAKGYELVYSSDKKFKKSKKTVRFTGTSKTIKNRKKGKTYYVKVRAYKVDSTNSRVYGSYSSVKKVEIKK